MKSIFTLFSWHLLSAIFLMLTLSACSGIKPEKGFSVPQPLRTSIQHPETSHHSAQDYQLNSPRPSIEGVELEPISRTTFEATPAPPTSPRVISTTKEQQPAFKRSQPISINVDNLPLPAFINEVFGNLLGLDFQIDSTLKAAKDLVTLRISQPQTPQQFYRTVRTILADYGVSIVFQGNLLRFLADKQASSSEPPLLVSGRTLPSVPITHRTVFQYIELKATKLSAVDRWLQHIYHQQDLKILRDIARNALILKGPPEIVRQAVQVVDMFDRPLMRSRHSVAVKPTYIEPTVMANNLIRILKTEGYEVGNQGNQLLPLVVLPIAESNLVLIFSSDQALLAHAQRWAARIDRLEVSEEEETQLFFYPVENTTAKDIDKVLQPLLKQLSTAKPSPGKNKPANVPQPFSVVLDERRNALIFQGSVAQWKKVLPLLKKLDVPSKMALIEVIVAEITLTDEFEAGIEWLVRDAGFNNFSGQLGTRTVGNGTGLGIESRGLTFFPISSSGQTRAALSAFASNNRVSVLSNPRVMVRSGESANIRVGSEVPVVTTSSSNNQQNLDGSTTILQQIQYRKTGVTLNVKPTIHSGSQIDLEISQEVSNAILNETSGINSPVILNRNVNTTLSISDGGSVFLGGMISTDKTDNVSGVPLLSDIPILGNLFKVNSESVVRTEMVMLIIPYILNNAQEAIEITEQIQDALSLYNTTLEEQTPENNNPPEPLPLLELDEQPSLPAAL